ncbi:hypothetical protein D2T32_19100 [Sinirhodobacter populi]|nr:hypothetical protein D2T32_19100 [Sinirhodobacter populi]
MREGENLSLSERTRDIDAPVEIDVVREVCRRGGQYRRNNLQEVSGLLSEGSIKFDKTLEQSRRAQFIEWLTNFQIRVTPPVSTNPLYLAALSELNN